MGSQNVTRVYTYWTHLDDKPFRALGYMALVSMDKDATPKYFGGRDALAQALGHKLPSKDDTSPAAESARSRAYASVKRVMRLLHDADAIETVEAGSFRRNAVYALHLQPVDNRAKGAIQSTPKGVSQSPP